MNILISGATGFIGRYVVSAALSRGHDVVALCRCLSKAKNVLPFSHSRLTILLKADFLLDANAFEAIDALIHLEWNDVGKYQTPENMLSNLEPQFRFLQLAFESGLKNVSVAGSCLEYGKIEGIVREDMEVYPCTYYGLAKVTLYRMLRLIVKQDVNLKWLRYFYVYGEGQRNSSLYSSLNSTIASGASSFDMSPGDQLRDFIDVRQLASNTLAVSEYSGDIGVINVGSGVPLSVEDFILQRLSEKNCQLMLNKNAYSYPAYEPMNFWADIGKLEGIIGVRADT